MSREPMSREPVSREPVSRDRPWHHRLFYQWVRRFCAVIGWLFFPSRVVGREQLPKSGGAMLCSNHQSFIDPVVVGVICHPADWLSGPQITISAEAAGPDDPYVECHPDRSRGDGDRRAEGNAPAAKTRRNGPDVSGGQSLARWRRPAIASRLFGRCKAGKGPAHTAGTGRRVSSLASSSTIPASGSNLRLHRGAHHRCGYGSFD